MTGDMLRRPNKATNSPPIYSPKKETREFNGRRYVMEEAITAKIGLVKAWKADPYGNLIFRGTARNFNPECAMASKFTIAEVEELVPSTSMTPEEIHLPGNYIKAIVQANYPKPIEKRTVQGGKPSKEEDEKEEKNKRIHR